MGKKQTRAVLPQTYDCYVFDLYGTLMDIRTTPQRPMVWEKLALFYGYYGALYAPEELRQRYDALVSSREQALKADLERERADAHEASPEIEITDVFSALFTEKGVAADRTLCVHAGQFFRVLATEYVRTYPGTQELLADLKAKGKRVYLLSNAQRIFTEFELHTMDISRYFDDILISSDYRTKKPDPRFFRILMERHGLDPDRTLFIGNNSRTDIAGAMGVGMHTFYVGSNISPEGDSGECAEIYVEAFRQWELA